MAVTRSSFAGDYPLIDYDFPAKCVLFVALLFAVGVSRQVPTCFQSESSKGKINVLEVVAVPTGLLASGFAQDNLALEPYAGTCSGLQQSRNRPSTFQELTKYREEQRRLREEAATKIEKARRTRHVCVWPALRHSVWQRHFGSTFEDAVFGRSLPASRLWRLWRFHSPSVAPAKAQKTVLCELKDKAFKENCLFQMHMGCTVRMILPTAPMLKRALSKDNPYKLHMVKFLEQKTTAGRLCKKALVLSMPRLCSLADCLPQAMFLLIILNVLAVIAESMSWVKEVACPPSRIASRHVCLQIYRISQAAGSYVLNGFELFSVLVFTFEYSANVWSAPANSRPKFQSTEHAAAGAPS